MLHCLPQLKAVQHNEHRGDLIKCQESAQKSRDVKAVGTSSGLAKDPNLQGVTKDNFYGLYHHSGFLTGGMWFPSFSSMRLGTMASSRASRAYESCLPGLSACAHGFGVSAVQGGNLRLDNRLTQCQLTSLSARWCNLEQVLKRPLP